MEIPIGQRISRWMRLFLSIALIVLLLMYVFFVSKVQATSFFSPQSLQEAIFIILVCVYAIIMFVILVAVQSAYFPSKEFVLMRWRTIFMILSLCFASFFLIARAVINAAYIWPFLMSPALISLSYILIVCATSFYFLMLLSDRLYAKFIVASGSIESWHAFQDLKYLVDRLILLCPVIGLPPENPNFWRFLLNSEYYLYRAVIIILDSRALLADFLSDSMEPGTPQVLWEENLLQEAIYINQALQSANPSNDFLDVVETYRRISRDLFVNQKNTSTGVIL
jgi:hypothetical protein